ncbi:hypothetical protein ES703_36816 [subsurface metagenome]
MLVNKIMDRIQEKVFDEMRIEDLGKAFLICCRIVTRRHYRPPEKRKAIRDELSRRFREWSDEESRREESQWLTTQQLGNVRTHIGG